MGTIFQRHGRYAEAVKELHEASSWRRASRSSNANWLRPSTRVATTGRRRAERQAVEQQPDDAELNWLRGDSLLFLQKAQEAIPPLKKALEADPKLLTAHQSLGRAYMQLGQDAAAVPHLKAALPLDQDGSLHYQLGQAYRSTGQIELAKQTLTTYQQMQRETKQEQREAQEEIQITAP